MTNPPSNPQPSPTDPLGFDEFIGIFIAFTTIGAILFWSIGSKNQSLELNNFLSPQPSPSVEPTPTSPQATVNEQPLAPTESTELTELTESMESPQLAPPIE